METVTLYYTTVFTVPSFRLEREGLDYVEFFDFAQIVQLIKDSPNFNFLIFANENKPSLGNILPLPTQKASHDMIKNGVFTGLQLIKESLKKTHYVKLQKIKNSKDGWLYAMTVN